MKITEIISIATVAITLILGVCGFIINSYMQRKNNSINIITATRLERRKETQRLFSLIMALTDYDYNTAINENERKNNIEKIVIAVSDLISLYTYSFPKDTELLNSAKELKRVFCEKEQCWGKIEKAREEFERIAVVYIYTEWKRIKLETVGKNFFDDKKLPAWENIYSHTLSHYNKNYIYTNSSNDLNYIKAGDNSEK